MSKNVAVFVDVANIFYAAKAAGVDIDYVTLLKAATAGRDFVRAYAYTGLDPENDNQRQFHAFLGRSGYKVISKDIRKYGDGRIKANLDIELVVDLMKTARNLDIAVVVSGDGDFASAIRAVQEMGVRVEVISFRGNTSSDLIEVADLFTDIAQVARVEKGSVRSGRRVAAEGDLSMTEVPDKETEGAPRRRRSSRAAEARPVAAVEHAAEASNLVVLPGERLSRVGEAEAPAEAETEAALDGQAADGPEELGEDGRRRRRRRGGRGRGRGRRGEEAGLPVDEPVASSSSSASADADADADEEYEPQPAQLAHHTFGSVWDSQIGVPSAAMPQVDTISGSGDADDDDLDEPEVPEYLLAERRQGGQRPGQGGRTQRGRAAYQVALDRERFGRSAPQPSFSAPRAPERSRDRGRGGRPVSSGRPAPSGRPAQGGRPMSPPRRDERPPVMEARTSSEPWSEVPPELEELLRAEMSRKQTAAPLSQPIHEPASTATPVVTAKPAPRRRTTKAESADQPAEPVAPAAAAEPPAPAKATRTRTKAVATTPKPSTRKTASAPEPTAAARKKTATRRRSAAAPAEEG